MKHDWKAGQILPPAEHGSCYTAGIDIKNHGMAIAIYAETEDEAVRRRNFILAACADYTAKGDMLSEQELLNMAAEHGFGRMVAKEKKHRVAPPPPDIFVGAWDNFLALARAIPSIYRARLMNLRDNLQRVLGGAMTDEAIVKAVEGLTQGCMPPTEPTQEQVNTFKKALMEAHEADKTYDQAVRAALRAAMAA